MDANAIATADIQHVMEASEHVRLWDAHAQRIYRYCFRRTADRELAEDLTSIVFLEAWRRRGEVELSSETERPWLYGVAANVLRNQWRSQRRYRSALARLPRPRDEADLAQAAVDRLDDQERMAQLLDRLESLPRIELEVLSLCAWEDLSPKEAAVALGVPETTVRTRLHRARKRLREPSEADRGAPLAGLPRIEGDGS